jgi:hypothetical protein
MLRALSLPSGHRRRTPRAALLATLALAAASFPAGAQLAVNGNETFREDDFDVISFEALNNFGRAVATCDFDGDGFEDLAIGSPFADYFGGLLEDIGAVHVAYGGENGLSLAGHQTLTQPFSGDYPPEEFDQFGEALAAGDFDDDGFCDLAVGIPFDGVGVTNLGGAVNVFPGTSSGLSGTPQVWSQASPGIAGTPEVGDDFGATLAAGNFDGDEFDDLAIAAPGEDSGGGMVWVLYGTGEGLEAVFSELIYQGDPQGTPGTLQAGDGFGRALAAGRVNGGARDELLIGAPGEGSGALNDAGWVLLLWGQASGFDDREHYSFSQANVGQAVEQGDQFGYALAIGDFDGNGFGDLAIGSPTEDVGPPGSQVSDAGSVIVVPTIGGVPSFGDAYPISQGTGPVSDEPENSDRFGEALASGNFDADSRDDLAVGVLFEDFEGAGLTQNGAVHALYGSAAGLVNDREQFHGQAGWGVGTTENLDSFGEALVAGRFDATGADSLVVGVPREDVDGAGDAGVVGVIRGRVWFWIFRDDFESGDTGAWDATVPGP